MLLAGSRGTTLDVLQLFEAGPEEGGTPGHAAFLQVQDVLAQQGLLIPVHLLQLLGRFSVVTDVHEEFLILRVEQLFDELSFATDCLLQELIDWERGEDTLLQMEVVEAGLLLVGADLFF